MSWTGPGNEAKTNVGSAKLVSQLMERPNCCVPIPILCQDWWSGNETSMSHDHDHAQLLHKAQAYFRFWIFELSELP